MIEVRVSELPRYKMYIVNLIAVPSVGTYVVVNDGEPDEFALEITRVVLVDGRSWVSAFAKRADGVWDGF